MLATLFAGCVVIGFMLNLGPLRMPDEWRTVGDLSRAFASKNVGHFSARLGGVRASDVRRAVLDLCIENGRSRASSDRRRGWWLPDDFASRAGSAA